MSHKIKKIIPPNTLKNKVGSGGISPALLERAEEIVEAGDTGFDEYVEQQIITLERNITALKEGDELALQERWALTTPVMALKAHGAMFGYKIISNIANEVLHILEASKVFNDDLRDILRGFKAALHAVLDQGGKAIEGDAAQEITQEVANACIRYSTKYEMLD